MPELFREYGFRFFFYSNEHEPIHIHVSKGKSKAKFVYIAEQERFILHSSNGFKVSELATMQEVIDKKTNVICETWKNIFYGED